MSATGRRLWFLPMASIVAALILSIMPLPDAVAPFRPDWVAVVLIYWSLIEPRRYGLFTAFWLGLVVDPELNATAVGQAGRVSPPGARLPAYAIPADEESVIARDTLARVREGGGPAGPAARPR